ncbi:GNAT family N-acetyltransferase [Granulosicoccaceae sp. 1_MG-2023]|nr:GNAT family N-acetyltransferase [Granulosicoccaceae sp. 1_MG-2023]
MSCQIRITDWDTDREALSAIRMTVFVDEQKVPEELELDEEDADAVHALALDGDLPVGTARLLPDGRIGRMAVLKSHRGSGVGAALLRALIDLAAQRGHHELVLNAQLQAIGFYEHLGFCAYGGEFDDAGIPHRAMRLKLSR